MPRQGSRWSSSPIRAASDRRLARRASNGDRRAIGTIFERYQQELYGFCLGLLGEPQDAQDALQNTMVKVLQALPGEEREIALRPWLYRIARNEAIELRRSRRPTQTLEGHLVDGQSSVTDRAEQREQLEWLLRDLGDLPERQRTVLVMRELNGLDFAEIGAALDTSGAVVRQSLYEARRNLGQMDHGRGMKCEMVARVLSDADGRITRRRDIRAHLRDCPDCRRFRDAIGRREGVLAAIPPVTLPAGAAAAVAQALLSGSGGSGAVAALAGGVAKSAGAYGALKAAGTLAAVALIGTAAIQGGMKGAATDLSPRHVPAPARDDSSRLLSGPRAKTVPRADAASPPHRLASTAEKLPSVPVAAHVAARRPRSAPAEVRESAFEPAARPADLPPASAPAAPAPVAEPAPGEEASSPSKPEKPAKRDEPEPPAHPSHSSEGRAVSGTGPPPRSESDPGQTKTPPGQAKKQAGAEAQAPPPAARPVETEPAAGGAETTQPTADPGPNGKAKGHEN